MLFLVYLNLGKTNITHSYIKSGTSIPSWKLLKHYLKLNTFKFFPLTWTFSAPSIVFHYMNPFSTLSISKNFYLSSLVYLNSISTFFYFYDCPPLNAFSTFNILLPTSSKCITDLPNSSSDSVSIIYIKQLRQLLFSCTLYSSNVPHTSCLIFILHSALTIKSRNHYSDNTKTYHNPLFFFYLIYHYFLSQH